MWFKIELGIYADIHMLFLSMLIIKDIKPRKSFKSVSSLLKFFLIRFFESLWKISNLT